jgi:hypothetical protein
MSCIYILVQISVHRIGDKKINYREDHGDDKLSTETRDNFNTFQKKTITNPNGKRIKSFKNNS